MSNATKDGVTNEEIVKKVESRNYGGQWQR